MKLATKAVYYVDFGDNEGELLTSSTADIIAIIKSSSKIVKFIVVQGDIIQDDLVRLSNECNKIPILIKGVEKNLVSINRTFNTNLVFNNCKFKSLSFIGSGQHINLVGITNKCKIDYLIIEDITIAKLLINDWNEIANVSILKSQTDLHLSETNLEMNIDINQSKVHINAKNLNATCKISNSTVYALNLVHFKGTTVFNNSHIHNKTTIKNSDNAIIEFLRTDFSNGAMLILDELLNTKIRFVQCKSNDSCEFNLIKGENTTLIINQCNFSDVIKFIGERLNYETIHLILKDTVFRELVIFDKTQPENLELINTLFQKGVSIPINDNYSQNIHSSVWCVLKNQALQSNDKIKALTYRRLEMDSYTKELKNQPDKLPEKIVLYLNKYSNNHGLSWTQGVLFTLAALITFYTLFVWSGNEFFFSYLPKDILWFKQSFWEGALSFLWLPSIEDEMKVLKSGLSRDSFIVNILSFLLGKIFIAFGIYQTVAAFRKHGKI
ncbi:MAG: hypothetical protein FD170_120 [Bacteroidetes bacterium]|nr:MAG: hypothetical protein FD170_120 [Bacteroidota bacterium]